MTDRYAPHRPVDFDVSIIGLGRIGLPLALNRPGFVKRLVILNTFMWSLKGDKGIRRAVRVVDSGMGRFLYRRANFSLRTITPKAFADRKKLTREIHGQYLAPFPDADSRGQVLWALAHARGSGVRMEVRPTVARPMVVTPSAALASAAKSLVSSR